MQSSMKFLLLLPVFCLVFAPPVSARVGETEAECVARYGKPTKETAQPGGNKISLFQKSAFDIKAVFDQGKAVSVTYSRTPRAAGSGAISPSEQQTLMRVNGGKKEWRTLEPTKADDKYETTDGKMRARYNRGKKYLEVYDTAWNKTLTKLRAGDKKVQSELSRDLRGL
jgi:hypothetical protein